MAKSNKTSEIGYAIGYLLDQQHTEGYWGEDGVNANYLTAIVMHRLWHYRFIYQEVNSVLDKASPYLLTNKQNDGWGSDLKTALVLIGLSAIQDNVDNLSSSIQHLKNQQQPDGSWSQDVYLTAMMVQAIQIAEQGNPETVS